MVGLDRRGFRLLAPCTWADVADLQTVLALVKGGGEAAPGADDRFLFAIEVLDLTVCLRRSDAGHGEVNLGWRVV